MNFFGGWKVVLLLGFWWVATKLNRLMQKVERKAENMKKFRGFTLAEVLITLAIIGIVAAITLPSLLVNVNEKAWEAQRKALHARMAQAIGQMNTLGGYGQFETDDDGVVTEDTAAESFILDALSKVYKINNVCGPDKLSSCGMPSKITTLGAKSEINFPTKMSELNEKLLQNVGQIGSNEGSNVDTKAAAFEAVNGESVAVFYNPYCGSDSMSNKQFITNKMCVNFIYDLNGSEGPNQVGKDVGFITALYKKNSSVVAPLPYKENSLDAQSYNEDKEALDASSSCKLQGENLRLPNRDEIVALFVNNNLLNIPEGYYWTGSVMTIETGGHRWAWTQDFYDGSRNHSWRSDLDHVRCIYR